MTRLNLDITEGIDTADTMALINLVRGVAQKDAVLVEVGSWKGYSASVISRVLEEKGGHLYCVDHWKGSEGTPTFAKAQEQNIYQLFEYNLKVLGLWDFITPMVMNSLTASRQFKNNSIDLLFIDADHRYKQFKEDLEAWYPKVRGIICGHDCEGYYSMASPEEQQRIDEHLEPEYIQGFCHTGIVRGLFDFFNDGYYIALDTRIWFKKVK